MAVFSQTSAPEMLHHKEPAAGTYGSEQPLSSGHTRVVVGFLSNVLSECYDRVDCHGSVSDPDDAAAEGEGQLAVSLLAGVAHRTEAEDDAGVSRLGQPERAWLPPVMPIRLALTAPLAERLVALFSAAHHADLASLVLTSSLKQVRKCVAMAMAFPAP